MNPPLSFSWIRRVSAAPPGLLSVFTLWRRSFPAIVGVSFTSVAREPLIVLISSSTLIWYLSAFAPSSSPPERRDELRSAHQPRLCLLIYSTSFSSCFQSADTFRLLNRALELGGFSISLFIETPSLDLKCKSFSLPFRKARTSLSVQWHLICRSI